MGRVGCAVAFSITPRDSRVARADRPLLIPLCPVTLSGAEGPKAYTSARVHYYFSQAQQLPIDVETGMVTKYFFSKLHIVIIIQ